MALTGGARYAEGERGARTRGNDAYSPVPLVKEREGAGAWEREGEGNGADRQVPPLNERGS